jgi:hypothetical protein
MVFVDDYSSLWVVLLLKSKSDTFNTFKSYKAHIENVFGIKILALVVINVTILASILSQ